MRRKLVCILVANAFATVPALAQETSDFKLSGTFGVGGISTDNNDAKDASKLNEYRDLSNGLLSIVDVRGRSSTYWLDAFGENFGRDDQYLSLRGGAYDSFKYRVYSDALKHNFLFDGITPYAGSGSTSQTAKFPSLNTGTWNALDIGYKRRDDGVMFEFQGASPWYGRIEANQVTSKGTKPGASSQGTSPGNGFVELSLPVDYETRNVIAEIGYNTLGAHYDLSVTTSKFNNNNDKVNWTNGYFGNGTDTTYLPADNKYTRIAGNATFRQLPWSSTFAARFTTDELKSDVALGTSVLNNVNGSSSPTGPSDSSFKGKVNNDTFTLSLASSPVNALDTRVYYNYRRRDDQSSQVSFDSTAIPGPFTNEPFSYKKNNFGFDAYYRFSRANRIGGGYDYDETSREGRFDYDRTKDKKLFLEWKNSTFDSLGARLKYQRLERDSNFLLGSDGTGTTDPNFENRFITAFDLSHNVQDMWKLTLDYTVMANLDLGFEGIYKQNDYETNTLGRLKDKRSEVYLNAAYVIPGGIRFTIFGDAEEIKYDSTHRIIGSGSTTGAYDPNSPPTSSNYNWNGNIKDKNWAFGIGVDIPATDKLSIKASAIYYKTDGNVGLALQDGTPSSVAAPLPIDAWDDSKRTTFNIKAVYVFNKQWTFSGGYAYEKYEYKDSQYDGYRNTITSSSNQDAYLNGVYANPQYKAQIVYGMVNYTF